MSNEMQDLFERRLEECTTENYAKAFGPSDPNVAAIDVEPGEYLWHANAEQAVKVTSVTHTASQVLIRCEPAPAGYNNPDLTTRTFGHGEYAPLVKWYPNLLDFWTFAPGAVPDFHMLQYEGRYHVYVDRELAESFDNIEDATKWLQAPASQQS